MGRAYLNGAAATSASIVLRFNMLMQSPPEWTPPDKSPEEPPRGKHDPDTYFLVFAVALLVVVLLMITYALSLR